MNIFAVHFNPHIAAQELCDQHVVKMPIESAQMLSTALHEMGITAPYKRAFVNHPCSIWARQSSANFLWLLNHGLELCKEHTLRFNTVHSTLFALHEITQLYINNSLNDKLKFPFKGHTPFAMAMPEKYKTADPIYSYRIFYYHEKKHFARYTKTKMPSWLITKEEPR